MITDVVNLYRNYLEESSYSISSMDDAIEYIANTYNLQPQEVQGLVRLGQEYVQDHYSKEELSILESNSLDSVIVGMFITAFFFGMYVSDHMGWGWEDVSLI